MRVFFAARLRGCDRGARAGAALALVVAGASAAFASDPARYLPPSDAPYQAQEVRVRSFERHSLGGTLTVPLDARRKHPAVILIGPARPEDRDGPGPARPFYELADTLSRRGIAVLRLDDRGVGASTGSRDSATTFDRSYDTRAALRFLRARPDIDRRRIGLVGFCEGGLIAPMIASADTELAAIVVVRSPGRRGRDLERWQKGHGVEVGLDGLRAADSDGAGGGADPWSSFFAAYDPIATARSVRVPVLILADDADASLPAEDADRLAAAFRDGGNSDATVRRVSGLDDLLDVRALTSAMDGNARAGKDSTKYRGRLSSDVLGTIADWLGLCFAPDAGPRPLAPHTRSTSR